MHKYLEKISFRFGDPDWTIYYPINKKTSPYYESVLRYLFRKFRGNLTSHTYPPLEDDEYVVITINHWGNLSMLRLFRISYDILNDQQYLILKNQYPEKLINILYEENSNKLTLKKEYQS